jgi:hypothetical protein
MLGVKRIEVEMGFLLSSYLVLTLTLPSADTGMVVPPPFPLSSVADPDPSDPYVLGLLDPDPLARGTGPDPSIIKRK